MVSTKPQTRVQTTGGGTAPRSRRIISGPVVWTGIGLVSLIYICVTLGGMLVLVDLGLRGASRFSGHALEKHERQIIGGILILLSALAVYL